MGDILLNDIDYFSGHSSLVGVKTGKVLSKMSE